MHTGGMNTNRWATRAIAATAAGLGLLAAVTEGVALADTLLLGGASPVPSSLPLLLLGLATSAALSLRRPAERRGATQPRRSPANAS
jgi:hypothetical protein